MVEQRLARRSAVTARQLILHDVQDDSGGGNGGFEMGSLRGRAASSTVVILSYSEGSGTCAEARAKKINIGRRLRK